MTIGNTTNVNTTGQLPLALDVKHLNASTFGDLLLREEILKLFHAQLEQSRLRIVDAASSAEWRFVTHTLKGAAAAVGASEFVRLTTLWENQGLPDTETAKGRILSDYDRAAEAFRFAMRMVLAA